MTRSSATAKRHGSGGGFLAKEKKKIYSFVDKIGILVFKSFESINYLFIFIISIVVDIDNIGK